MMKKYLTISIFLGLLLAGGITYAGYKFTIDDSNNLENKGGITGYSLTAQPITGDANITATASGTVGKLIATNGEVKLFADGNNLTELSASLVGTEKMFSLRTDDGFSIGKVPSDGFIDWNPNTSLFRVGIGGRLLSLGDRDGQGNGTILEVDDINGSINFVSSWVHLDAAGGVRLPRMTTTERDALSNVDEGIIIYNLTTHHPNYFNGTSWIQL